MFLNVVLHPVKQEVKKKNTKTKAALLKELNFFFLITKAPG